MSLLDSVRHGTGNRRNVNHLRSTASDNMQEEENKLQTRPFACKIVRKYRKAGAAGSHGLNVSKTLKMMIGFRVSQTEGRTL